MSLTFHLRSSMGAGSSLEQAMPHLLPPKNLVDPNTLAGTDGKVQTASAKLPELSSMLPGCSSPASKRPAGPSEAPPSSSGQIGEAPSPPGQQQKPEQPPGQTPPKARRKTALTEFDKHDSCTDLQNKIKELWQDAISCCDKGDAAIAHCGETVGMLSAAREGQPIEQRHRQHKP